MEIEIGSYNLDDDLLDEVRRDGLPRVRIYRPDRTVVVLGRGSDPEREIEIEACLEDGVPVLKRRGGGCAVVLDPGNVIVTAVLPVKGYGDNDRLFGRLSGWLLDGLRRAGIPDLYRDGISDLVAGGRKVSGACIYRSKNLLFYSSTLLVEPDTEKVERYLKHPPREPDYRRGRRHGEFIGSLYPEKWPGSSEDLVRELKRSLHPGEALCAVRT